MPRPKERTPELKQRLLDVAMEILAADGVAGFTTRRVAEAAGTSAPAIYELFGDKAGFVRAIFFEGFRRLLVHFDKLSAPVGNSLDIVDAVEAFRQFTIENPRLFEVMYSKPFHEFSPGPDEQALGDATRNVLVDRIKSCIAAGEIAGDPTDIAHAVLALCIGLASQETGGWLGSEPEVRDRRWAHATESVLRGYQRESG